MNDVIDKNAQDYLKQFVSRVEKLEEDKFVAIEPSAALAVDASAFTATIRADSSASTSAIRAATSVDKSAVNTASALLGCDWVRLWQFIKIEWQNPVRGSHHSNLTPIAIRRFVRHFMPWEDVEGIMHRMTVSQEKEPPTLIGNYR
jgi:hypothetical protein